MSSQYFLYTWNVPVGHPTLATIAVHAETPEQARQLIATEVFNLQNFCRNTSEHTYDRESAEIRHKLSIIAATTLGMRIDKVSEEIHFNDLSWRISALLERMKITVEPSSNTHSEAQICH